MINNRLIIATSNASNGSMSKGVTEADCHNNRSRFLASQNISLNQTILVNLTYDSEDYHRYSTVNPEQLGDGITRAPTIVADALFTSEKGVALLLPIADCIGAVLYDPRTETMGLSHLGRHNLEQNGGSGSVHYMLTHFRSDVRDIQVWLSPAAGEASYPLYAYGGRSLHQVAIEQLLDAGIDINNTSIDSRDTTTDSDLFSHSEFLKGNQSIDGRQAVVCMMKP